MTEKVIAVWRSFGVWRTILPIELLTGAALVGIAAGQVQAVLTLFAIIAGLAAVYGVLVQRTQGQAQQAQLDRQAEDIAYLAEVARRQQGQQPSPLVEMLALTGEAGPALEIVRAPQVIPDRLAIVAGALEQLREASKPLPRVRVQDAFGRLIAGDEDRYQQDLSEYEQRLHRWVERMAIHLESHYCTVRVPLRFRIAGAATLEDAEVVFSLPAPLKVTEESELAGDPTRPPRRMFDSATLTALSSLMRPPYIPDIGTIPAASNIQGPWAEDAGRHATYRLDQLLHGRWDDDCDPLLLSVPEDGEYVIGWEI